MTTMSAKRHLRELQWRLMLVAAFFIIGACLAYSYQSTLIPLLLNPLGGEKLVYLNPAGGFSFIFMISIYAGIALAFPVLLQQLYAFLKPVLPVAAQRKSTIIIISSLLLLISGVLFGYLVAVPNALTFLYAFADQYVEASLTAESYLNFIIAYTIGIGIVFQLPLLLLLVHTIKPLKPGGLLRSEKWVVLVAFIIAAIITPTPDPVNQAIIAGPVVVVYQIGVIAVLLNIAKSRRTQKKAQRVELVAQKLLEQTKRALQPTPAPLLSAMPLALEDDPIQDHTPILETALTLEAAETAEPIALPHQASLAKLALANSTKGSEIKEQATTHLQPIDSRVAPKPTATVTPQATIRPHSTQKTMDGVIRRTSPRLEVPQRQTTQVSTPPVRTQQQVQNKSPQKAFYVDGISAPRRATSF